jgi:plastocyanin
MSAGKLRIWSLAAIAACVLLLGLFHGAVARAASDDADAVRQIIVPEEDRFTPFAITVHVGQKVVWINNDEDDHTVVSDDAFNTAGHFGTNVLLPANGGRFVLRFKHPGVFPFYCRFHAVLDEAHQPKAPGPDGGIQDPNGNYGTPMEGVITVVDE